jgi:quercetin dioxygenase-like cupin family protein
VFFLLSFESMQKAGSALSISLVIFTMLCGQWALPGQTGDNVRIDNARVRVLAVTEQPGHRGALHEHPVNRVMVYLDSGHMIEISGGKKHELDFKAGEVRWSPAGGPHTVEYVADHPIRIVEVELKGKPTGSGKTSELDPLKVDSRHYSLLFENDEARALRVRFGPNEKGVLHEHALPHVVVYLTDQARGKAGEVRFDEPMTHTEQNPLDHSVERIAIDVK